MLKDITLGQYFPGNTIVHRLDPRTKLIAVVLYIMWTQGFEKSVILIPIWIAFMFGLYTILSWKKSL